MYDIAVIGGGTAGLTAAIYGCRAGKSVAVFESTACGGQIINSAAVDNFPAVPHIGGLEFGKKLEQQATEFGAALVFEEVLRVSGEFGAFKIQTDDGDYEAKTVILASGTKPRKLGLAEEERFEGRGVSYCATCDGAFYRGKRVAVYGGGDTALHEVNYLADVADEVYLLNRRDALRANPKLVEAAKKRANVKFLLNSTITGLSGDKKLEKIRYNEDDELRIDALFVAIGRLPQGAELIEGLAVDENGYVIAGDDCRTNLSGVFVAGDVRTKELRQLITAGADGAMAATAALNALNSA